MILRDLSAFVLQAASHLTSPHAPHSKLIYSKNHGHLSFLSLQCDSDMAPHNIRLMHFLPDNNMAKSGDRMTVRSVWYSTGTEGYLAGGMVDEARGWPLTSI